jgi:hypothetical protein
MGDEAAPTQDADELQGTGVRIAFDDFGTGYWNLEGDVADVMQTVRCPSAPRSVPTRCGGRRGRLGESGSATAGDKPRVGSVVSDKDSPVHYLWTF